MVTLLHSLPHHFFRATPYSYNFINPCHYLWCVKCNTISKHEGKSECNHPGGCKRSFHKLEDARDHSQSSLVLFPMKLLVGVEQRGRQKYWYAYFFGLDDLFKLTCEVIS
ncbi:hypothetical protein FRX31_016580 [Thalictrum thalictroides]|uniref:Uncharacterized protein n=1 Tax=Thalictrum thalictroides TaxID=46969 RepID=A0A7J6W8V9_THATH|nr:hypothetical protein FRX31_016580 [Thalictrum thalictroides]